MRRLLPICLVFLVAACTGTKSVGVPASTTMVNSVAVAKNAESISSAMMSGADKLAMATESVGVATFAPTGIEATQVGRALYRNDVSLDVYYPPDYQFDQPLPTVVFVNAFSTTAPTVLIDPEGAIMDDLPTVDFQNADSFISLGNMVAASGMIAVVYGTGNDPRRDLSDAMTWLLDNTASLGIDPDHLSLWMFSAHTLIGLRSVMDPNEVWAESLECAVVYYGWMPHDDIRTDLPVHVVKALEDDAFFIYSIDAFMAEADKAGAPVDYYEVQGPHAFDLEPEYADVTSTAFRKTLRFLKGHLSE